jgi:copper oxidase (laccase) domain-containing protein
MKEGRGIAMRDDHILFQSLQRIGWLRHCFTTREFMDSRPRGERGRIELCRRLRDERFPDARAVVWGEQVHGAGVASIGGAPAGGLVEVPGVDALICGERGVCLVAWGADCPIVYIADVKKRIIALVHSGRAGSEDRILTACVGKMAREFASSAADCVAAVSPSIGPCCYPVDLWRSIEEECRSLGIGTHVNARACTACRPALFFSYRRERDGCGRMLGAMMITGEKI